MPYTSIDIYCIALYLVIVTVCTIGTRCIAKGYTSANGGIDGAGQDGASQVGAGQGGSMVLTTNN